MPTTEWNLTPEEIEYLNSMLSSPFHDLDLADIILNPETQGIYIQEIKRTRI